MIFMAIMTPADLDPAATVVLSWLLTYAIHSTITLGVAALVAWRLSDQPAWLDVIWKTALLAPLATASLHLDPIALPLGGRWAIPSVATVTGRPAAPPAPAAEATPARATTAKAVSTAAPGAPAAKQTAMPAAEARPAWWQATARRWRSIAAAAWLLAAMVAVVWYVVRLRRVYAALGSGSPVSAADLQRTIDDLCADAKRRRPIQLTATSRCPMPLALAGRRIVLPERFFHELDPDQQRAALAHEVAHVTRRDPEWRIAVDIVERVLFFQPLNRLARARLCDSAEFLCDEWAVRQTQSPLALARCLSLVAAWWPPARRGLGEGGVSAIARSESAMIRRVTRILSEPAPVSRRPRLHWLALPIALLAVGAPRVTATPSFAVTPAVAAVLGPANVDRATERPAPRPEWTAADTAATRQQIRDYRTAAPGSLDERWRQALADAARLGSRDFWIVYAFTTPTHAGDVMLSDTRDGSIVTSDGQIVTHGPPLTSVLGPSAVPLEGGKLAVLLHYGGARADAIDRAGYRSMQLGFDFGRAPVFWLGDAPESESFARVQILFGQTRTQKVQVLLIELASLHSDTNVVAPFLARLLEPSWPVEIRREAAEGFDHHHDPRSVEILLRVARTDPDSSVRTEAAETIGEVQTPESIPALTDLVSESTDPAVRREAAEAFASQPAARALPAIEAVIATSGDDGVLDEAIEALGELDDPAAVLLLLRTANTHPNVRAQVEAVETLGDRHDDAAAMAALEGIAREHDREEVQVEAIETIGDLAKSSVHPLLLALAVSGRTARIRKEALDAIGESVKEISDATSLDRAQAVIERAIFDDPDPGVREDALDALDRLPDERALRALRDVIARHPDARVRREAGEHLRERQ